MYIFRAPLSLSIYDRKFDAVRDKGYRSINVPMLESVEFIGAPLTTWLWMFISMMLSDVRLVSGWSVRRSPIHSFRNVYRTTEFRMIPEYTRYAINDIGDIYDTQTNTLLTEGRYVWIDVDGVMTKVGRGYLMREVYPPRWIKSPISRRVRDCSGGKDPMAELTTTWFNTTFLSLYRWGNV